MRAHFIKILVSLSLTFLFLGLNSNTTLAQDGTIQWHYKTQNYNLNAPPMTPSIGQDGSIYVVDAVSLYAISPAGALKWKWIITGDHGITSSPAIGSDGTIYIGGDGGHVFGFKPDGNLRWDLELVKWSPNNWLPCNGDDGHHLCCEWLISAR